MLTVLPKESDTLRDKPMQIDDNIIEVSSSDDSLVNHDMLDYGVQIDDDTGSDSGISNADLMFKNSSSKSEAYPT